MSTVSPILTAPEHNYPYDLTVDIAIKLHFRVLQHPKPLLLIGFLFLGLPAILSVLTSTPEFFFNMVPFTLIVMILTAVFGNLALNYLLKKQLALYKPLTRTINISNESIYVQFSNGSSNTYMINQIAGCEIIRDCVTFYITGVLWVIPLHNFNEPNPEEVIRSFIAKNNIRPKINILKFQK